MSYSIVNGVLHHDGKPQFALGQSYYPSYHTQKVPVLEDGDRVGEMVKDLRMMKEAGFNIVRMAALGQVETDGDDVHVRFDLPDSFCRECEKQDLAAMIRLQGYSMNLRGFADATMLNERGEKMPFNWGWFVRNSLNHPGIYEDNVRGTVESARHFAGFPAVTSFQIYNEPAYPTEGFYDYHPYTLERFTKWCGQKGLPSYEPPRKRPAAGEDPKPWIYWRLFQQERLNDFLCDMGRRAREGYAAPANLTCHMGCPVTPGAAVRGEDYFATAEGMDILGITAYNVNRGPSFHQASMVLDACESAAATFGKRAWLIEYNARTDMPPQEWPRETYAAVGRGFKGILYYQWRADYPFADAPEPEGFGMLFNDGRKASSYDIGIATNRMLSELSTELATMRKLRDGVGILYSNYANAYADATENGAAYSVADCHERSILATRRCYTLLNERSLTVDFARACDLAANPLGIRVLVIPFAQGLSEEELDGIEAFERAGGHAYRYLDGSLGFERFQRKPGTVLHGVVTDQYDVSALLALEALAPGAELIGAECADVRLSQGDGCLIAVLTNYDPMERPMDGVRLRLPKGRYTRATAYATDLPAHGEPLTLENNELLLPALRWGAIVTIEQGRE